MTEKQMAVKCLSLAETYEIAGIKLFGGIHMKGNYVVRYYVARIAADGAARVFLKMLGSQSFPFGRTGGGKNLHFLK
jgi:hypothetical protein